jgi:hypothetical protein
VRCHEGEVRYHESIKRHHFDQVDWSTLRGDEVEYLEGKVAYCKVRYHECEVRYHAGKVRSLGG